MSTSLVRTKSRRRDLLSLVPYLKRYKGRITLGIFMVLFTTTAAMISPWILRSAVNDLYIEISRDLLFYYASLIVAVSAAEGIFRYLMRRVLIGVSRYIEYDLRNDLFAHLQSLPPRFYQQNFTGDVMSRATNDLSAVRMVLGPGIMYSVTTIFTTVLTVSILATIDWHLSILTLFPLIGVSYCVKYFGKQIHSRSEKIQEQLAAITTLTQENVSGIRVIKAYNQEQASLERFRVANNDYIRWSLSLVRISAAFHALLTFLLGLSTVALLWYGGRQVIQEHITLGGLVAFMAYLARLAWPTIALGWVINVFERGNASMGRINRVLHTQPEIRDEHPKRVSELSGSIEVKNLTFSYNGVPVLRDVQFQVHAGETLAIVGGTGSGKSTLVNLLCRLFPVPEGTIIMDGIDINDIPLEVLRKSIGYVPQDTFLFSETVKENIAFGRSEADFEAIEETSRISDIWPDIQDFSHKFETFVGERGITLSGGQKQRIAISRALLTEPKVLILDDAFSSVDTYTEERILQRLSHELTDRTAILISHRVSTVKLADQILVLEDGQIVERGTHLDLLEAGGHYADLYEKQLLKEELGVE